jgi:hypothetical protein
MRRQAELFRWHLPVRSFAPAGAGRLAACGPRAGARGYVLSPLSGLGAWPLAAHGLARWRPWLHSFAPAGAGRLAACGPRAGARGYILSPLTGLVFDRLRHPFSSRRGLGQAFLAAGGGNYQPLPSRGIQERVGAIRPFLFIHVSPAPIAESRSRSGAVGGLLSPVVSSRGLWPERLSGGRWPPSDLPSYLCPSVFIRGGCVLLISAGGVNRRQPFAGGVSIDTSGNVSANSFVGPLTGHAPADLALTGGTWLGRSVAIDHAPAGGALSGGICRIVLSPLPGLGAWPLAAHGLAPVATFFRPCRGWCLAHWRRIYRSS